MWSNLTVWEPSGFRLPSGMNRAGFWKKRKAMNHHQLEIRAMKSRRCGSSFPRAAAAMAAAIALSLIVLSSMGLSSCSGSRSDVQASGTTVTVGVAKVVKKSLGRELTLSSELVPFQEIDVYAKESTFRSFT